MCLNNFDIMRATYNKSVRVVKPKEKLIDALSDFLVKNDYKIIKQSSDSLEVSVSANFLSWGELVTVSFITDEVINIKSQCKLPTQVFDWGKNRKNVNKIADFIDQS